MKIADLFNNLKLAVKLNADTEGFVAYIPYASKKALTMLSKYVDKFEDDSDIDYELGVITHDEHIKELAMVKMMRDSIRECYKRNYCG